MLEPVINQPMPFMMSVLYLLVAARVGGEIMERLGQPAMLGELLGGVVLGPLIFGVLMPSAQLRVVADLGVFFLVLLAGLEMKPGDIWEAVRGRGILVALAGFLVPLALGIEVGWLFGLTVWQTAFLGLCIAITALPISVRLVMDTKIAATPIGRALVGAAVVNDIIALLILGLVLDATQVSSLRVLLRRVAVSLFEVGVFIALVVLANRIVKLIIRLLGARAQHRVGHVVNWFKGQEALFALSIFLVLIFASVAEGLGLHFLVGAFIGGMLLSGELMGKRNYETVRRTTTTVTMGFLAPIFFGHIGLEMTRDVWQSLPLLGLVCLAGVGGKFLGGFLGARWAGFSPRESAAVGVGLNGRGTMDLIIATIALERSLINRDLFSALVFMSITVTVLVPWAFRIVHRPLAGPPNGAAPASAGAA